MFLLPNIKNFMKISIIIPVYNVAQYIEECLNSVIAQTYMGDMECLIVDDCGTDDSIAIAKRIIQDYQGNIKFQILHHEHNRGLSAARNTGIEASTGDYLYFLDSDDSIIPECLELMVDTLKNYPRAEIVQAGATSTNKSCGFDMESKSLPVYSCDKYWIKCNMLKRNMIPVTAWNKLIRRDFLIRNNLFFKEGILHEDEHWNFFVSKRLTQLAICHHNTYKYNVRNGSIITTKNDNGLQSWFFILDDFIKNIDVDCKSAQVGMIFGILHPMYVFQENKLYRKEIKELLLRLSHEISFIGKITICAMLCLPNYFNRKKIIYTNLVENCLASHF